MHARGAGVAWGLILVGALQYTRTQLNIILGNRFLVSRSCHCLNYAFHFFYENQHEVCSEYNKHLPNQTYARIRYSINGASAINGGSYNQANV